MDILDKITDADDTYFITLLLLYSMSDIPEYSLLSELIYLTDHDSFMNIMKYFEGQTIRIPTKEEIQQSLRLLILYGYIYVDKMSWWDAFDKAGIPKEDRRKLRIRLRKFVDRIQENNYRLGGIFNNEKNN